MEYHHNIHKERKKMECVSWKIEVVNELTEGTGIKILSSKRMLQRLFSLFKQYKY